MIKRIDEAARRLREYFGPMAELRLVTPRPLDPQLVGALRFAGIFAEVDPKCDPERFYLLPKVDRGGTET